MYSKPCLSALLFSTALAGCSSNSAVVTDSRNGDGGAEPSRFRVQLTVTSSAVIPTVGIARWSLPSDHATELRAVSIHYVLQGTERVLTAPVDLTRHVSAENGTAVYETPLLGMKQNSRYEVFVEAKTRSGSERSETVSLDTGHLPTEVPRVTMQDFDATQLHGGFTVACTGPGGGRPWAFIWDNDGDVVWAHPLDGTSLDACTRARLSYDGDALWVGDLNLAGAGGALARLDLTGAQAPVSHSLPGRHHDFAVLPNGHLVYFKQETAEASVPGGKRDVLYEFDPDTEQSAPLYDQLTDFAAVIGETPAHTNYVAFVPELSAISFSMLTSNTIGLVSYPEGKLMATFGGTASDFEMGWTKQHGHQVTEQELLVFSNQGENLKSVVLSYSIDLQASTAQPLSRYVTDDHTATFGDVKRLANGNVLVTYSNAGALHELNGDWQLLRRTETVGLGYVEHRSSLYGPPPPFAD